MNYINLWSSVVICYILLRPTLTFPQGGPVEACDSLMPRHVNTHPLDLSKSPYFLVQSANRYGDDGYSPVKGIKVEIGGAPFKGFFITAIDPLNGKRIGHWVKFKGTDTLPCSSITHSNPKPKRFASLVWIPPADRRGYVVFEATVVKSYSEYFVGLVSVLPHQLKLREHEPPSPLQSVEKS